MWFDQTNKNDMRMKIVLLLCLAGCLAACQQKQRVRLLQLNVWQEGTSVEDGYEALVDEIARVDADFVMLSEVRNYNNTRFCDRITASLKEKGKTYYSFYSYDSGLLSKYPIVDSAVIFPEKGDHGSIYKLVADMDGQEVAVYTAHLDYLNCSYYLVRGYSGTTWERLDSVVVDVDSLLYDNMASHRDDAIRSFLADAQHERDKKRLVFIGGDFNEPSHLDWTEATKDSADHNGVVIPWTVTTLLENAGFKDSYREHFPDPVKNPGYTYPADARTADVKRLAWAAEADERERIDFIFYDPFGNLSLTNVSILGPRGSIRKGERIQENTADVFVEPLGIWPTDHKGVIAEFQLKE